MIYKILLADDEGVALEALRVIISSEFPESCDIRIAPNASHLKDIYAKYRPDILLLNIHMANIHGLSTIQALHEAHRKCAIIVLSYSYKTNFGNNGKNLGIVDYIRKPMKKDILVSVLKKTMFDLSIRLHYEQQQKMHKKELDKAVSILEHGMINEIIFSGSDNSTLLQYIQLLDISAPCGWILGLKFSQMTEHGTMCNPIGSTMILENAMTRFRKIVKAFLPGAIIGQIQANHLTVYIPCEKETFTEEEETYRQNRTYQMCFQLQRKLSLRFKYGCGSPQPIHSIQISLKEARNILES